MPLGKNIPLLYIYSIFIKRVSMPIIIIYFLLNNLSLTQVGILAAVMAIATIITEIHGGIFADIYGRKLSLALHSVFGILTMFFYFIGNSFEYFLIASITYGLAGAFISGTRNSILYDTLLKKKKEKDFKKYSGKIMFYSHIFNAFFLLIIPVIYVFNVKLPFLIGILFFAISLIAAILLTEPQNNNKDKSINKKLFSALKEITINKNIIFLLVLFALFFGFVYTSAEFTQPILKFTGLEVIFFGIVYALKRAVMGIGGGLTHKLEKYSNKKLIFIGMILLLITLIFYFTARLEFVVLAILLLGLAEGFNRIVFDDAINKRISSKNRTTVLSVSSLLKSLVKAIFVLSFAIYADLFGLKEMCGIAIILFLVILVGMFVVYKLKIQ